MLLDLARALCLGGARQNVHDELTRCHCGNEGLHALQSLVGRGGGGRARLRPDLITHDAFDGNAHLGQTQPLLCKRLPALR
eukprot:1041761-Lingulodinium_polyedra.AAC.1